MSFIPTESIVTQMAAKSHKIYLGGTYQGSELLHIIQYHYYYTTFENVHKT